MSSAYGLLRGTRALFAAAKSAAASAPKAGVTAAPSKKVAAAAAAPPKSPKKKKAVKAPSGPTGIQATKPISPTLQEFLALGEPEISRVEAVKKVWDHIKSKELQNPANKREIFCDEKLKTIFQGKDKVTFLEIGALLSHHFVKTA